MKLPAAKMVCMTEFLVSAMVVRMSYAECLRFCEGPTSTITMLEVQPMALKCCSPNRL